MLRIAPMKSERVMKMSGRARRLANIIKLFEQEFNYPASWLNG